MRDAGLRTPALRLWAALLFGLALAVGLALGANPAAHAQDGGLAIDCEGNTRAMDTDCQFGEGQEFQIAVHVTESPDGGYFGFQARLQWGGGSLEYQPTEDASQEAVWPDCGIALRADSSAAGPLLYGCVPFPSLAEGSTLTGTVAIFTFACGDGSSEIELVAGGTLDSSFLVSSAGDAVTPSVSGATVTCEGPERDRPEPEVEAGVDSTLDDATAEPSTPESAETPNGPTPTADSTVATPDETPDDEVIVTIDGQEDGGDGFPVWGWVLIGLAVVAGAGGLGFVAWRRMRAGGDGEGEPGGDTEADTSEGDTNSDGGA